MKDSPGLHLKTFILILFLVLFAPIGNVLLSKGMKGIGSANNWELGDLLHILVSVLSLGYIWLGIACLLAFFVAYMLALTWADYSYVQPASSFSYAVVAVLSYYCCWHWWGALRFTCNESGRRSSRLPARRAGSLCGARDTSGLDVDRHCDDDAGLLLTPGDAFY